VKTEENELGLRVPSEVEEPTGPSAHLEVPFDLSALREHDPDALRHWRFAVRDAFRAAGDLGYEVVDFLSLAVEHEKRCFYLLAPASKTLPEAGAPPNSP
jgi:predicted GNAT superfamily acetyltransferase